MGFPFLGEVFVGFTAKNLGFHAVQSIESSSSVKL